MRIKLVYAGEGVKIPKLDLPIGVGLINVWIDGKGYTSASNDLGATGYILLETPDVDIGEVSAEKQAIFGNLHASIVSFTIKPNVFLGGGGMVRITMAVPVQRDGELAEHKLDFIAENCTGVSLVTGALSFSVEMLVRDDSFAQLQDTTVVSDEQVAMLVDEAPAQDAAGDGSDEAGDRDVLASNEELPFEADPEPQAEPQLEPEAEADAEAEPATVAQGDPAQDPGRAGETGSSDAASSESEART